MRKFIALVLMLTLVFSIGTCKADLYSRLFQVIDIDHDVVTIVDSEGNMFQFEDADDWEVDDFLTAIMFDNDTDWIDDDVIIKTTFERPDMF